MDKKKKIILISVIAIVIVIAIVVLSVYFVNKNKTNTDNNSASTKVEKLYNTLTDKKEYSFSFTLDDNNKLYYAKSGDTAYTDTTYNGSESKYVIKDGNSYLLMDESKKYYTYANNTIDLNLVIDTLEKLKEEEHQDGEEQIDGKNYNYEEYSTITELAISDFSENTSNAKTRLYFQGDKLVYIKTIAGDKQELLKVETTYKVYNQLFNIPSDYTEG